MSSTTEMTNVELPKLIGRVKQWIEEEDLEDEQMLADRLNACLKRLEPNPACLERSRKKPRYEVVKSNAAEDDRKKTKDLKDAIRLIVGKCKDICKDNDYIIADILTQEKKVIKMHNLLKCHSNWEETFNIWSVVFRDKVYRNGEHFDEDYNKLQKSLSPIKNIEGALNDLFNSNQLNDEGNDIIKWDEDFVIFRNLKKKEKPDVNFSQDMAKSAAAVITGESGSGKSWFVKKWLPLKYPDASFIYHEIDDYDAKGFDYFPQRNKKLGEEFQNVMKDLCGIGKVDSEVYQAISELSRHNNFKRNYAAGNRFDKIVKKAVEKNSTVASWWDNPKHCTLEELVIILDEMGKAPNLGRGIVDEVRQISIRICNKKLAKKVMIVIVGSGLDYYLGEDSLDFDADASETVKFGTDPMKSNVTILDGPNLKGKDNIGGISTEDIMGGTYSQVLATNTRMLTRGIIPILKSKLNTLNIDNPSSRRVELGSTNVVMDYAARVYIDLNGLKRLSPDERENLLLKQFRILVQQYRLKYKKVKLTNPVFEWSVRTCLLDYEAVLRAGLITANITDTSKALRYLACKGQTAPLNAQDGIAFEIVLQHHLVRLCRAEYHGQDKTYYCDRYTLVQPWPPSSAKKNGLTQIEIGREVMSRYDNEKNKIRLKKDAVEIAKLLNGKNEYDLVLRQTISNVQGADVLVLSKRSEDWNANLDLYQAKHYNKIPSRASKETIGAFASLGICYEPQGNTLCMQPQIDSAGYNFMGTNKFAEELSEKLQITVSVRKRVVVFSESWESFLKSRSWKDFDFEAAEKQNVCIWSREMVEPTISALVTGPAFNISNEGDELAPE